LWYILWPLGIFDCHLVYLMHFVVVWYIFPPFRYVEPRKLWQPNSRFHLPNNYNLGWSTISVRGWKIHTLIIP
jgi:hypothetical protein